MSLLRKAAIIVAAMLGSAIIVSILIALALSLTPYGVQPAEMLPYTETKAFFVGSDPGLLPLWQSISGHKNAVKDVAAVALITPEKGSAGTIVFERKIPNAKYDQTVGSFGLRYSDMALVDSLQNIGKTLSSDAGFRLLASRFPRSASWMFLKTYAIPSPTSLTDTVLFGALIGKTAQSLAIARTERGWMASMYDTHVSAVRWNAPRKIPYMENPLLIFSSANIAEALQETVSALPADTAAILEGLIAKRMTDIFGSGISTRYDIEPLLEKPTSVQLSSSGGSVQFLIAGSMNTHTELTRYLSRLHGIFGDALPTAQVLRRTLDPRFPSVDVREKTALTLQDEEEINGWTVNSTVSAEYGRALVTAVRGSQYMLSNNLSALRKAITMPETEPVTTLSGAQGTAFVAGGQANIPSLEQLLKQALPGVAFTLLPLHGNVRWSIERTGKLRTVFLETVKDATIPKE